MTVKITAEHALMVAGIHTNEPITYGMDDGETSSAHPSWLIGALAVAVIVGVALLVDLVIRDRSYPSVGRVVPAKGVTIFAVFFVTAAAIERLLQPLSDLLPSAGEAQRRTRESTAVAGKKVALLATVSDDAREAARSDAKTALDHAARTKSDSQFAIYTKTVTMWAVATVIAMVASAGLNLYFLHTVGIATGPRWAEILATGLIIGSGTKPLHDLVELIQATSTKKAS